MAVVGSVAGSVVAGVAGSGPAGGRLVAVTSSGAMVTTSAVGADRAALGVPAGPGLVVSPDGRYLATGTGDELSLVGNQLVSTGRRAELAGPPGSWRAIDFADHDRALVAVENGDDPVFGGLIVEAQTFSGRTVSLGEALDVAGDPRALGVFAVGVGPATTGSLRGGTAGTSARPGAEDPTSEVEIRDAGTPTVVLAGSAQLARDVGLPAGEPVVLSVEPDPGGGKVAVAVAALSGRTAGLVVVSRRGRVLGALRVPTGALEQPAWSPDGTTLVLSEPRSGRPAVLVWRIGHRPQVRVARASTTGVPGDFGYCLWTARSEFLCADTSVLMVWESSNAHTVAQAVEGPLTVMVPASALQLYPRATLVADQEASPFCQQRKRRQEADDHVRPYGPVREVAQLAAAGASSRHAAASLGSTPNRPGSASASAPSRARMATASAGLSSPRRSSASPSRSAR